MKKSYIFYARLLFFSALCCTNILHAAASEDDRTLFSQDDLATLDTGPQRRHSRRWTEHPNAFSRSSSTASRNRSESSPTLSSSGSSSKLLHLVLAKELESPKKMSRSSGKALLCSAIGRDMYDHTKQCLVSEKVNPNFKRHGLTPLHMAVKKNDNHVVRLLLKYGAFPDVRDDHENLTPLQMVVSLEHDEITEQHIEIVKLLLEAQAIVTVRDKEGFMPLHIAIMARNEELVRLLLVAGATYQDTTADGKSAADLAQEVGFGIVIDIADATYESS